MESNLNQILIDILNLVKNLSINDNQKEKLGEITKLFKKEPKGINQASAKIMSKRNPLIKNIEEVGAYKTNTFYCKQGTLLINTIRTYLNKFSILPIEADVNGTCAQLKVNKESETSALRALMNDDFWSETQTLSQGTKMPVIKKVIYST